MTRLWCAWIVVAVCAGCRNSPPVMDPFLGRQVVDPPGTAVLAPNAPPAPPYYSSAPASTVGAPVVAPPAGTTVPAATPATPPPPANPPPPIPYSVPQGFSPAPAGYGKLTPNVSTPDGSLVQPVASTQPLTSTPPTGSRPMYGPPGGLSYPQAAPAAAAQQPALAQQSPPGLLSPAATASAVDIRNSAAGTPTVAKPAGWQAADNNRSVAAASAGADEASPAVVPTSGSTVRIIEPTPSAARASSATTSTRTSGEFRPGNTSTLTMPTSGVSSATLNQSLAGQPIRDLADLPPVRPASFNAPPAASVTAAAPASSSNYGYEAQYRWVKGKLEYSQSTRTWRLRYIPPDAANDNYGGSVIIADAGKLAGLQHGDYVVAYGTLGQAAADQGSFAAMYNVTQIQKQ